MSDLGHELELERELEPHAPSPAEPPARPPRPLNRASVLGALLCLTAAVLTVVGALQVFVSVHVRLGDLQRFTMIVTAWEQLFEDTDPAIISSDGRAPANGVPLLVCAALLLAAAVLLAFGAVRPVAGNRWGRAGALAAVAAAAFVVATAGNVALQVRWWANVWAEPSGVENSAEASVGPGLWSTSLAAALAVAAAVIAVIAWRPAPQPAEPERVEPATEPLGLPVLVRRLEDAPPDEPQDDYR
ncbi:hypothetical protein [Actinophytocola sp.]|uniref:hypothetical protein n=1 Tax=Actinophytocola sp. TaxID=1872138 RepID=UPI002D7F10E6|nr:hypothetical protein [Actinophytocola sp.]HET9144001.1 hypothetical protein [Actinophytocola sp.]